MPTSAATATAGEHVIAGDHDRADVHLAADAHGFLRLVARRIHHADQPEERQIALDVRLLVKAVRPR